MPSMQKSAAGAFAAGRAPGGSALRQRSRCPARRHRPQVHASAAPFVAAPGRPAPDLPDGDMGWPNPLGHTLDFLSLNMVDFHRKRYEKYGKVYKSSLLFGAVATVYDPADIRALLNGEGTLTLPDFIPGFKDLLGRRSLLFATGKKHAQQRRILSQAFTGEAVRSYAGLIDGVVQRYFARWDAGGEFQAYHVCKDLAFDVAACVLLGMQLDSGTAKEFREDYDTLVGGLRGVPVPLPGTDYTKAQAAKRRLLRKIESYIRRAQAEDAAGARERPTCALTMMIRARDDDGNAVDMEELKDQVLLQLFAGHETTGHTMSALLRLLWRDPRVLERLQEEQAAVVARHGPQLTGAALESMPYTDAVIREGMRVHPIIMSLFRRTAQDIVVGGRRVPKGWRVQLMLGQAQKDIQEFSEDSEAFRPERWLTVKRDPSGYTPFGSGPHICLGMGLAIAELRATLAMLGRGGRRWEQVDPNEEWVPPFGPMNGLRLRFLPAEAPVELPPAAEASPQEKLAGAVL